MVLFFLFKNYDWCFIVGFFFCFWNDFMIVVGKGSFWGGRGRYVCVLVFWGKNELAFFIFCLGNVVIFWGWVVGR